MPDGIGWWAKVTVEEGFSMGRIGSLIKMTASYWVVIFPLALSGSFAPRAAGAVVPFNFAQLTDTSVCGNDLGTMAFPAKSGRVTFSSFCDFTGGNADGNSEIFEVDLATNTFTQLTATTGCDNIDPSFRPDGSFIVFQSNCDLVGTNADGNNEIFLLDLGTTTFSQVTHTTNCDNFDPSFSRDGVVIAFSSLCDLTGGNPDGNEEIFTFKTTNSMFTQLTTTTGCSSQNPSLTTAGLVALSSDCDYTGGNADGNTEIFRLDPSTNHFTQITHTSGTCSNDDPSINSAGTLIGIQSDCDLTGGNGDGNLEIFLFSALTQSFTQVTDTKACDNRDPSLTEFGQRLAIVSSCDLTGGNADGNEEIFLSIEKAGVPVLSPWGLVLMGTLVLLIGVWGLGRKLRDG
jgi:Tol biopolymer transport system component